MSEAMNKSPDKLSFYKMQGAGNDFVVLDNRDEALSLDDIIELSPRLCDRRYGVGADGVLVLELSETADYRMVYRNADGSDAGMCGNGARCLAVFARFLGFPKQLSFIVHDTLYRATLGPNKATIHFPMNVQVEEVSAEPNAPLLQLYTGTEHVVKSTDHDKLSEEELLVREGRRLRYHELFQPAGTNVNFIHGLQKDRLEIQTYERGVENLTLACGTGAIAGALAWHYRQHSSDPVNNYSVEAKGGTLNVLFEYHSASRTYSAIKLEGPAHFVFEGSFYL